MAELANRGAVELFEGIAGDEGWFDIPDEIVARADPRAVAAFEDALLERARELGLQLMVEDHSFVRAATRIHWRRERAVHG